MVDDSPCTREVGCVEDGKGRCTIFVLGEHVRIIYVHTKGHSQGDTFD